MSKKNEWFEFHADYYDPVTHKNYLIKMKVQKRYIDRLFNGTDVEAEVSAYPFKDRNVMLLTIERILEVVRLNVNRQSSLLTYFKTKYPEYLI